MQERWVSAKGDSRMRGEREWVNFLYILRDFDSGVRSEKSVEIETHKFSGDIMHDQHENAILY